MGIYLTIICFFTYIVYGLCSAETSTRACINLNQSTTRVIKNIFVKHATSARVNSVVLEDVHFERLIDELGIKSYDFDKHRATKVRSTRRPATNNKRSTLVNDATKTVTKYTNLCLNSETTYSLDNIKGDNRVIKKGFYAICPALIRQINKKVCIRREDDDHDGKDEDDDHEKDDHGDEDHDEKDADKDDHDHDEAEGDHDEDDDHEDHSGHSHGHGQPKITEVWGYGLAAITVISILCLSIIAVIPCLKKSFYSMVMSFLVALAVGTLTGDAMLHLIPHAFLEGSNSAGKVTVKAVDELDQHYSLVYRGSFVLMGMYLFFIVEQVMIITKGSRHGHSHGDDHNRSDSKKGLIKAEDGSEHFNNNSESDTFSEKRDYTTESSIIENGEPINMVTKYADTPVRASQTKDMSISSVAWMVMVGDGFHNFSDGLAVGAAFSSSLSSGLSTSIAIFCHELPHELGDFAILIKNGMTIKQALIYNVTSAILAYLGLVVGILAGENEFGRHLILSITAGLFLYVSLVDMLPELMNQNTPKGSRISTYICQHLGMITGVGIMLVISLYEHSM